MSPQFALGTCMTKNPNPEKNLFRGGWVWGTGEGLLIFFCVWGGGGGEGGRGQGLVNVHEQMFQMALLLFKENSFAKLF